MYTPVQQALRILALPEGPDHEELRKQAREYIRGLDKKEYDELKKEAMAERDYEAEEEAYMARVQLFKQLCFTDKEIQAYARMRIDSPGVRRMIARRALLMKYLKRNTLPRGMTFYEVAKMEDSFLRGMSDSKVMRELGIVQVEEEAVPL